MPTQELQTDCWYPRCNDSVMETRWSTLPAPPQQSHGGLRAVSCEMFGIVETTTQRSGYSASCVVVTTQLLSVQPESEGPSRGHQGKNNHEIWSIEPLPRQRWSDYYLALHHLWWPRAQACICLPCSCGGFWGWVAAMPMQKGVSAWLLFRDRNTQYQQAQNKGVWRQSRCNSTTQKTDSGTSTLISNFTVLGKCVCVFFFVKCPKMSLKRHK